MRPDHQPATLHRAPTILGANPLHNAALPLPADHVVDLVLKGDGELLIALVHQALDQDGPRHIHRPDRFRRIADLLQHPAGQLAFAEALLGAFVPDGRRHPVALGFQMPERLQGLGKRRDLAAQAGHGILCDRQIGGQSAALLQ